MKWVEVMQRAALEWDGGEVSANEGQRRPLGVRIPAHKELLQERAKVVARDKTFIAKELGF